MAQLERQRKENAKKGGFLDIAPETEKGVLLNSVVLKRIKAKGVEGLFLFDFHQAQPSLWKDTVENLRAEIGFYSKRLKKGDPDIVLYNQPNLFVFVHRTQERRVVKTVVQNIGPTFGFTEVTSYYFDEEGRFAIENLRQKHEEKH